MTSPFERKTPHSESAPRLWDKYVTPEEYAERAGEFSEPHIEVIESGKKKLICFGAKHTKDPEDPQFDQIAELIGSHQPELVLIEGMRIIDDLRGREAFIEDVRSYTREEASKEGESFFTLWKAIQNDIQVDCPEPTHDEIHEYLLKQGVSKEAIFVHQMLAHGAHWKQQEHKEDVEAFLHRWQQQSCSLLGLTPAASAVEQTIDYAQKLGIQLDRDTMFDKKVVDSLTDPIPWKEEEMSEVNMVSQISTEFRDRHILQAVQECLEKQKDSVMIVYGASHIHMLSPVFHTLLSESLRDNN